MLFGDLHRGVTEQDRDLVNRYTSQQHLDREGVAEHVRMASFPLAIELSDIGDPKEPAVAPLPVGNRALGKTVAAPEKVSGIRLGAVWNVLKSLNHFRRKRHIDRLSSLCLIE